MKRNEQILHQRKLLNVTRKEFSDALGFNKEQEKKLKLWEEGKEEIPDGAYQKIISFPTMPKYSEPAEEKFTQIDLFAGIGGIRLGFQRVGGKTVFSSEWNKFAEKTYRVNYGEVPVGDITQIDPKSIPDHDILLGGFPCQPFSQAGLKKGFADARGTLFFNIAAILKEKKPKHLCLKMSNSLEVMIREIL